jgi:hypothetical protein
MASDFDALLEGASPEEAKRLWRILTKWLSGDENSFPVQHALLTRAQWRCQARIPHLVNESVKAMDLKWAEYRQQTAAMVRDFAKTADAKAKDLERLVIVHSDRMNEAAAKVRANVNNAEQTAERIKNQLESGAAQWNAAKNAYEAERRRLEEARAKLEQHYDYRDWVWLACLVLGMIGIGVGIGVWITWPIAHHP